MWAWIIQGLYVSQEVTKALLEDNIQDMYMVVQVYVTP